MYFMVVCTSACPIHALDLDDGGLVDGDRPEGVAQVVEAQRPQLGRFEGLLVAAAQGGAIEVFPALAGEDEIGAGAAQGDDLAHAQPRERGGQVDGAILV